ncbi:MAG: putative DNA-binding domain-containing protein [Sphingomonadales bacterium]|nr:putative DNA-binding domain-containing protein [Sphingomonadales bacterium]MBD3772699.1 putative DNA-binding domain-containing protein [Paracoccaceae bacterium]
MSAQAELAAQQAEFMAHVMADALALPSGWNARFASGLDIYRNAYRTRLVEALRDTFPRTVQWVGDEAFAAAAAHHLITTPPSSWTLDHAGLGFPEVLGELFANDPEVPELAWLEWAMHTAFVAADAAPLTRERFVAATAGFAGEDWAEMRLIFQPAVQTCSVAHDIAKLWNALKQDEAVGDYTLAQPGGLVVWREGLSPVFRMADRTDAEALALLQSGASYGEACSLLADRLGPEEAAALAGSLLGQWLADGLLVGVSV